MIQVGTLGYFWLRYDDSLIQLTATQGKIITALYCARGTLHQDTLIDQIWEYPAQIAPGTFRTHISRLRASIKNAGYDPDLLFTTTPLAGDRNAYRIRHEVQSDGDRATSLSNSGVEAFTRGDIDLAIPLLRQAASLWQPITRQDQILAAVSGLAFAFPVIKELWDTRREALTRLAAAEILLGLSSKAAASLERLSADWCEDREIARLLAFALYDSGKPGEAADLCMRMSALDHVTGVADQLFRDLHRQVLNRTLDVRSLAGAPLSTHAVPG